MQEPRLSDIEEQLLENHTEETFFLTNFDIDRVFSTIARTDYLFLYFIKHCMDSSGKDRVYLSELSESMRMKIPEISKAMEDLQDKGYVVWKTDTAAGRTYVTLTSKAIELMRDERSRMKKCYAQIREEISEADILQMLQTMKRVTEIVTQIAEAPEVEG